MEKIGIFGGTFDPVHNAHLELARLALEQYQLDRVLFIPTGMPVRKLATTEASAQDRLNMLTLACGNIVGCEVSAIEVERSQITYTIDTLYELKEQYGQESQLYLILGEDTATDLGTWKDSDQIATLAHILYAERPGDDTNTQALPAGFECYKVQMPVRHISSSCVRSLLHKGEDVSEYIPKPVLAYIRKFGLYGRTQKDIH